MVLVSSPVVLCLGLDWVLLVSLDYNCSTAHFTNEQLSRRHTPLSYRWRATTTPAAKRSHCVKRHQLLCKSPLDYCEIKSKTHIVSEKYLKDKNMAQYAIFIWYKCSVQHFNPVAGPFFGVTYPESSKYCLRSPVLHEYNSCWTCHLLPMFICFSINGMNSLLWAPSSNPLLELFILLYCHRGSNLTRSLSTKRVVIVMCHCQPGFTCCALAHFSAAEILPPPTFTQGYKYKKYCIFFLNIKINLI